MSIVSTNKIEANKYEVEVAVDADAFEAALQKAYLKARNKINVNGFRKGKAPRNMIEKLYGSNVFFEDAVNNLVSAKVANEVDSLGYYLVDTPDITVNSVSKENGVNYKVIITVKPDVEISDYKGIEVTKTVKDITDEDVDKEINSMREKNGRIITVEDRPAEMGDTVIIDFEGFKDGVAFDGGFEEGYELVLGSGNFIPGFESQIVGKNAGDEFTINVSFPENYQMEELAGAPAEFKIVLHEITSRELPDIDDDFVKDTSEFDTVDELKADIRKNLEERAAKIAESEAENNLFLKLSEKVKDEIPDAMFERKLDEMVREFEMRLSKQGIDLESYFMYTGTELSALRDGYKEQAEIQVKVRLALEKIAVLENVEISNEEVEAEIEKIAEKYKLTVEKVKSIVTFDSIKEDLTVAAASKIVIDSANIIS